MTPNAPPPAWSGPSVAGVANAEVYTQHALLSAHTGDLGKALRAYNHLLHQETDVLLLCKRAAIYIAAAIHAASFLWTDTLYEMIQMLAPYDAALRMLSTWSKINGDRQKLAALIEELVSV